MSVRGGSPSLTAYRATVAGCLAYCIVYRVFLTPPRIGSVNPTPARHSNPSDDLSHSFVGSPAGSGYLNIRMAVTVWRSSPRRLASRSMGSWQRWETIQPSTADQSAQIHLQPRSGRTTSRRP